VTRPGVSPTWVHLSTLGLAGPVAGSFPTSPPHRAKSARRGPGVRRQKTDHACQRTCHDEGGCGRGDAPPGATRSASNALVVEAGLQTRLQYVEAAFRRPCLQYVEAAFRRPCDATRSLAHLGSSLNIGGSRVLSPGPSPRPRRQKIDHAYQRTCHDEGGCGRGDAPPGATRSASNALVVEAGLQTRLQYVEAAFRRPCDATRRLAHLGSPFNVGARGSCRQVLPHVLAAKERITRVKSTRHGVGGCGRGDAPPGATRSTRQRGSQAD